jgi:hypothetical protein
MIEDLARIALSIIGGAMLLAFIAAVLLLALWWTSALYLGVPVTYVAFQSAWVWWRNSKPPPPNWPI